MLRTTGGAHGHLSPVPPAEYLRSVELVGKRRNEVLLDVGKVMARESEDLNPALRLAC